MYERDNRRWALSVKHLLDSSITSSRHRHTQTKSKYWNEWSYRSPLGAREQGVYEAPPTNEPPRLACARLQPLVLLRVVLAIVFVIDRERRVGLRVALLLFGTIGFARAPHHTRMNKGRCNQRARPLAYR